MKRPVPFPSGAVAAPLDDILGARANIRVLRTLVLQDTPLGRAELARRAGITPQGAGKVIDRLFDVGILLFVGSGRRQQVRLREEHPLASVLVALFEAEAKRYESLISFLKTTLQDLGYTLQAAWIEGPVATGTDQYGDPVMLGILAKSPWVEKLAEMARDALAGVEQNHDVTIEVHPYTEADLTALSFQDDTTMPIFGPHPVAFMREVEKKSKSRLREHRDHDEHALERGRRLADLLIKEPTLRDRALTWLADKLKEGDNKELREWQRILRSTSSARLRQLLTANSERAVRLRQSLPFWSILSDEEHEAIRDEPNDES